MPLFGSPAPPIPRAIKCLRCHVNTAVAHCEIPKPCGWYDCDLCLHRTAVKLKENKWALRNVLKPLPPGT